MAPRGWTDTLCKTTVPLAAQIEGCEGSGPKLECHQLPLLAMGAHFPTKLF